MTEQVTLTENHLGSIDAHHAIAVLTPPKPSIGAYPLSQRSGEPRRPNILGVSCGLLIAGAVISSIGLVKVLWDAATVTGYHTAARVLEWTKPDPVSFLTIVMVLAIGAIGALVATSACTIAYNAWNGRNWTKIGGIVAFVFSALTILLNPLAMVAMIPIAIGSGFLWLPQIGHYFSAWGTIRTAPAVRPGWATNVTYGLLPRYKRNAA